MHSLLSSFGRCPIKFKGWRFHEFSSIGDYWWFLDLMSHLALAFGSRNLYIRYWFFEDMWVFSFHLDASSHQRFTLGNFHVSLRWCAGRSSIVLCADCSMKNNPSDRNGDAGLPTQPTQPIINQRNQLLNKEPNINEQHQLLAMIRSLVMTCP